MLFLKSVEIHKHFCGLWPSQGQPAWVEVQVKMQKRPSVKCRPKHGKTICLNMFSNKKSSSRIIQFCEDLSESWTFFFQYWQLFFSLRPFQGVYLGSKPMKAWSLLDQVSNFNWPSGNSIMDTEKYMTYRWCSYGIFHLYVWLPKGI